MSRLVCPYDPACLIGPADRTCPIHLDELVSAEPEQSGPSPAGFPHPAELPPPADAQQPVAPPETADRTPKPAWEACWHCRRTLPDPVAPDCPQCHAAQPGPALALIFSTGTITLEPGERTTLGRSPDTPHAAILAAPNISHLHAVAWVDADGTPWIEDTHSTNGTFVNGEETPPEVPCRLTGGTLRFGRDNRARIHVRKG